MGNQKEDIQSPDTVLQDLSSKESGLDLLTLHDPKPVVSKWLGLLQLLKSKSKRQLLTLHPSRILNHSRRVSSSMREGFSIRPNAIIDDSFNNISKPKWKNFTFSELQTATKNFSNDNVIGKGGFAEVYKGCLEDGQLVAVKQLVRGQTEERIGEFLSELGNMAHINHPNTARLIGYGMEGGFYLVLELSPNGSLASLLQSSKEKLTWNIRYKIALGTARGLSYLHEGCQRRIIHRDIKAANILLTEDFEPQICDFGLAKWLPGQWTHLTVSKCDGTFGYLAPELVQHGMVDEKTDVFAFGVLLLELITGRRALNYSQQSLLMWARPLLRKNIIDELVDPSLNDYCPLEMNLMILAACLCVQESSFQRPQMNQVLLLLRGSCGSMELVKSRKLSYWEWHYEELFNGDDDHDNKTTCFNDVNKKNSCPHEIGWCLQV